MTAKKPVASWVLRSTPGASQHARASRTGSRLATVLAVLAVSLPPVAVLLWLRTTLTVPLWFNEQWRASYFSYPGGWSAGIRADHMTAMATGWFFVERWVGELFGSTELSLRLPVAIFMVLDCVLIVLLARRWMPLPVAVLVALVGGLTTDLVDYGTQIAPYAVDMATIAAVLLLYELASPSGPIAHHKVRVAQCYLGIGVACFLGSATFLVAAPVLLFDAARCLRYRDLRWRVAGIAGAGIMALVNLVVQLGENTKGEYDYWATGYPQHGFFRQARFYWDGLSGFVANGITDGRSLGAFAHDAMVVTWSALIAAGVVTIIRRRIAGVLLLAIGGSLVLTAVFSELHVWPFGFIRTNEFEVPLLVLVAAVGACGVGNFALRKRATGSLRAALAAVGVVALVLAAVYEIAGLYAVAAAQPPTRWGGGVRAAVATVRRAALPGAAVIVAGNMAVNGWQYYLFEYSGNAVRSGPAIPPNHVLLQLVHGAPAETYFLRKLRPSEVFLYIPLGSTGHDLAMDQARMSAAGYCSTTQSESFKMSGALFTVRSSSTCPLSP